ncbi:hypothetical protein EUX53_01950 [Pseudomonas orientalis]|nr:hypothetical protein EUX53_01950 [Pseudomonas orientalis]
MCWLGRRHRGHRYLHTSVAPNRNHDAKRVALDLAFDLDLLLIPGAPLNHAGRAQARCRVVGQERFAYFCAFQK